MIIAAAFVALTLGTALVCCCACYYHDAAIEAELFDREWDTVMCYQSPSDGEGEAETFDRDRGSR